MDNRERYAAHAMAALITKLAVLDREGLYRGQFTKEQLRKVRADIAGVAFDYADAMVAEELRRAAAQAERLRKDSEGQPLVGLSHDFDPNADRE